MSENWDWLIGVFFDASMDVNGNDEKMAPLKLSWDLTVNAFEEVCFSYSS